MARQPAGRVDRSSSSASAASALRSPRRSSSSATRCSPSTPTRGGCRLVRPSSPRSSRPTPPSETALRQLGAHDFPIAVVAIGDDIEASILTVSAARRPRRAAHLGQGDEPPRTAASCERVGAHDVVYPEHEMGERVAHLVTGRMLDYIEFDDGFALVETVPPRDVVGRPLGRERVRSRRRHGRLRQAARRGLHLRHRRHRRDRRRAARRRRPARARRALRERGLRWRGPWRAGGALRPAARQRPWCCRPPEVGPVRAVVQRVLVALGVLLAVAAVVGSTGTATATATSTRSAPLDALYYATVRLSTTGYGDITPLTRRSPAGQHPRHHAAAHPVPHRPGRHDPRGAHRSAPASSCGRTAGGPPCTTTPSSSATAPRAAARCARLLDDGADRRQIVAVDNDPDHIADASDDGIAAVAGDGTRADVLRRADVDTRGPRHRRGPRDDAAVLVTLTVRRHNATALRRGSGPGVRERRPAARRRRERRGRVLRGRRPAARAWRLPSPSTGAVFEDLLVPGQGLELAEREVLREEVGLAPRACRDLVVAVIRDGATQMFHEPSST